MKQIIFIIALLIIFFKPCKSQRFHAGIIAGAAITDVDGTDIYDADNDFHKFGAIIGGLVNSRLSKRSTVQMEIYYAMKGSEQPPQHDSLGNYNPTLQPYYTLILNYIDVSVLWRYNLNIFLSGNPKPTDRYGIELGGTLGTLVSASYSANSIDYSVSTSANSYAVVQLNPLDVSLFAGFYYNISPHIYFDFRYENSVIPVIPSNNSVQIFYPYYSYWNQGHNLAFELRLAYVFGASGESTSDFGDDNSQRQQ